MDTSTILRSHSDTNLSVHVVASCQSSACLRHNFPQARSFEQILPAPSIPSFSAGRSSMLGLATREDLRLHSHASGMSRPFRSAP